MPDVPSLLDPAFHARLPTPLARAASMLADETRGSGEHTTADEVVGCIEALFSLLGRLWTAEYLTAGAPDADANRMLHERLVAGGGRVLGGAWIGVARALRAVFVSRGLRPVARGLLELDFGSMGDDAHPVARLFAYRNSFAHGSFHSVVEDIRAHRALLEGLLARLPFLVDQPFLLDTGDGVVALRGEPERVERPGASLPQGHPVLLGPDGASVDLYPLAVGRDETGAVALAWPGKKDAGLRDIVRHARFETWFARYQRELEGDVEGLDACLGAPVAWPQASEALASRCAERERGLILFETAPGAPRAGALAAWADMGTLRWRVTSDALMGSGLVFAKALLRHAERALGLPRGTIACADPEAWRGALADAAARLSSAGRVLRVAIDDLHVGDVPTRGGEPSVLDVWRALAGGPFLAVGGAVRLWSLRPLPWDARVQVGGSQSVDVGALRAFLDARGGSPLHRELLGFLTRQEAPVDLFEACDALEAARGEGEVVFEPAIERALWDLAPLLLLGRAPREHGGVREAVRTFALAERTIVLSALESRA